MVNWVQKITSSNKLDISFMWKLFGIKSRVDSDSSYLTEDIVGWFQLLRLGWFVVETISPIMAPMGMAAIPV